MPAANECVWSFMLHAATFVFRFRVVAGLQVPPELLGQANGVVAMLSSAYVATAQENHKG